MKLDWQDAIAAVEILTGADCEDSDYAFALLEERFSVERVAARKRPPETDEYVKELFRS